MAKVRTEFPDDLGDIPDISIARREGVTRECVRLWRARVGIETADIPSAAGMISAAVSERMMKEILDVPGLSLGERVRTLLTEALDARKSADA